MNNRKKNVGIIGHIATFKEMNDGQTVKTREIIKELENYIEINISKLDTQNYKKRLFIFIISLFKILKTNQYIVLIVASGGAKVLIPLLTFLNIFLKRKICYCTIGSWIDVRAKSNKILYSSLKKLDLILVETSELKKSLNKMGLYNIDIMYNFKELNNYDIKKDDRKANGFCTFSRVMKEKGIEDAVYAIERLNSEGYNCSLDIYGPISDEYKDEFKKIIKNSSKNISYCGNVNPNESIKYISKYYMLLFPTHYIKEGLPGTLIDAYSSGTPVISANWLSAKEFVPESVGYVYEFNNKIALYDCIKKCINNKKTVNEKRKKAIDFSKKFNPRSSMENLLDFLNIK